MAARLPECDHPIDVTTAKPIALGSDDAGYELKESIKRYPYSAASVRTSNNAPVLTLGGGSARKVGKIGHAERGLPAGGLDARKDR